MWHDSSPCHPRKHVPKAHCRISYLELTWDGRGLSLTRTFFWHLRSQRKAWCGTLDPASNEFYELGKISVIWYYSDGSSLQTRDWARRWCAKMKKPFMKCPQMLKCVCCAKNLAYNFMHSLKTSQGEILVMALFCQGDLDLAKARSMTHW